MEPVLAVSLINVKVEEIMCYTIGIEFRNGKEKYVLAKVTEILGYETCSKVMKNNTELKISALIPNHESKILCGIRQKPSEFSTTKHWKGSPLICQNAESDDSGLFLGLKTVQYDNVEVFVNVFFVSEWINDTLTENTQAYWKIPKKVNFGEWPKWTIKKNRDTAGNNANRHFSLYFQVFVVFILGMTQ